MIDCTRGTCPCPGSGDCNARATLQTPSPTCILCNPPLTHPLVLTLIPLRPRTPPIAHRDVKSPNILVFAYTSEIPDALIVCKLADFGTAAAATAPFKERKVDNPVPSLSFVPSPQPLSLADPSKTSHVLYIDWPMYLSNSAYP